MESISIKTLGGDNDILPWVLLAIRKLGMIWWKFREAPQYIYRGVAKTQRKGSSTGITVNKENAYCLFFLEIGAVFLVSSSPKLRWSRSRSRHAPRRTPMLTLMTSNPHKKAEAAASYIAGSQTLRSLSPVPNLHVWITSPTLDRLVILMYFKV